MRLDQRLSQALMISRSDAKRLIRSGQVTIDGAICTKAATQVNDEQAVFYQDTPAPVVKEQYFILHKPAGYVCSHVDDGYPTALSLIEQSAKKLHFAGRLDADTTGLVLLSSDGQWCHRVSSPNSEKQKHYHVTLAEPLSTQHIEELEQGVLLRGETQPTAPCKIELIEDFQCNIALSEGKYHQVRRMFAAIGNHVTALHRFQIGQIQLAALLEGQYRPLSQEEIDQF